MKEPILPKFERSEHRLKRITLFF
uniref:Uncharacterized protein n=1 Tax=Oryza nivara TaxID=4536 RepID=A0A0E0G8F7_ORYNI